MFTLVLILFMIFALPINANAAQSSQEEIMTTREIIHIRSNGRAPSGRITLYAIISVNSYGKVIGIQSINTSSFDPNLQGITWTSGQINSTGEYAYCAVSYGILGVQYTETIIFYP